LLKKVYWAYIRGNGTMVYDEGYIEMVGEEKG
jgi:hypothetical protein